MEELELAYQSDPRAVELLRNLALSPSSEPGYTLHKGVIRYKDRIWLPAVSELQEKIVLALHASPAGDHSGIPVTLRRVKQLFFWKGMKASVWLLNVLSVKEQNQTEPSTQVCFNRCQYQMKPSR
jgi:hypothetical protein